MYWAVWFKGGAEVEDRPLALFLQEKWALEWASEHLGNALTDGQYDVLPVHFDWTLHDPEEAQ